jgi:hypothetical protein
MGTTSPRRRHGAGKRSGPPSTEVAALLCPAAVGIVLALTAGLAALPAVDVAQATAGSANACFGDCDDDGTTGAADIVRLVEIALGAAPLEVCAAGGLAGAVPTVAEIVRAVGERLDGDCAEPLPPTPTRTASPTATPSPETVEGSWLDRDRILRIEFVTTPPFVESLPNVLYALLGHVERTSPYGSISGALYDGGTLLGVSTSTNGCCGTGTYSFNPVPVTWRAPGSPWDFPAGDPATVEFSSLHDGSIDGRIDIRIDSGRFELDLGRVALRFVHATSSNGGSTIPPAPVLRSVRIVAAIPGEITPTPPASPTAPPATPSPPPPPSPTVIIDDDD